MSTTLDEPGSGQLVKPTQKEASLEPKQRTDCEDAPTSVKEQSTEQGVKPNYPGPLKLALILASLSLAVFLYGLVRWHSGNHHGAAQICRK